MINYAVSIQHPDIGTQPVTLLGIENAQLVTELENDAVYYRQKLNGSFKLKDGAGMLNSFTNLYSILTAADKCEPITATVNEICPDGSLTQLYTGKLEVKEVCLDKCRATVSIAQNDVYQCITDAWEKETNYFEVATVTATATDPSATLEQYQCDYQETDTIPFMPIPANSYEACYQIFEQSGYTPAQALAYSGLNVPFQTGAYTLKWCLKNSTVVNDGQNPDGTGIYTLRVVSNWWREVKTVASATVLPSPWQLLDDNGITARYWRCPFSVNGETLTFDNGRLFTDILQYTADDAIANFGVCAIVSNFLNINSTGVSISNDAYDNAYKVQRMIIYQQSDVKRFSADSNAGEDGNTAQFIWSLKEQLEFLKNTLNCYWFAEPTGDPSCPYVLRIEHISYFEQQGTVDLSNEFARNCYTYNNENAPQTEEYKWRNPTDSPIFTGTPITYSSACTAGKRTYDAGVNTDILYIANPTNEDKVPDEGFVAIATDYVDAGTGYYIINNEPGIITPTITLNGALSWQNLHERYWRHNRSLLAGSMNDIPTTFYTAKATIAAQEIRRKLCCGNTLNTNANYLTKPGTQPHIAANGRLKRFTLNLKTRTGIYEVEHSYA